MNSNKHEKTPQNVSADTRGVARHEARKGQNIGWQDFLDKVSDQQLTHKKEGKFFSRGEITDIRKEGHRIFFSKEDPRGDRGFSYERSNILRDAIIADIEESDWELLKILFGTYYVDIVSQAKEIIKLTDFKINPRKRINFAELLFEIHQEFNKKYGSLRDAAKTPEELVGLQSAKTADEKLTTHLWKTPNDKIWNMLFEEFKKQHAQEAEQELAFENRLLRPKTKEEVGRELWRIRGEMESLWARVGGPGNQDAAVALDEAMPSIKKIPDLHSEEKELEADEETGKQTPEAQLEALGKEYGAGKLDEAAFEEALIKVLETMSKDKAQAMGRVVMGKARLLRDVIPSLTGEERAEFKNELKLYEKMGRRLIG